MKTWRSFAWKEVKEQKMTGILILIALVLSTMMTTVVGQSVGILSAMREQQAASLNGNRYVTFHQLTAKQAELLAGDPQLSYAGKMRTIGSTSLPNSSISTLLREYEGDALSAYPNVAQLEKGRLPKQAYEIALPQDVLSFLGFTGELGGTITLDLHISLMRDDQAWYEYTQEFVLTGILTPNYLGYVTGTTNGIVGQGTAKAVLPERYLLYSVDIRTVDKKNFQATVDAWQKDLSIPDYCIQYNDTLLSALGIAYQKQDVSSSENGFSSIVAAGILTALLILLASGLVVYNVLKISITKRIGDYGILRAIGAERKQIYWLISLQVALLCVIGIPVGLVLGLLSAEGITQAVTSFYSPELFMASSQKEVSVLVAENAGSQLVPLAISAATTFCFAYLAAIPAVRYAAKVSPVVAFSGQAVKVKRRNRRTRRIRSFAAFYARMNMKRNIGRTAITILSLVMSITVFVALQSFSEVLDVSKEIQQMHLGDYSITNKGIGLSPERLAELKQMPGIESVSTLKYKLYTQNSNGELGMKTSFSLQPSETVQVIGLDEQRLLEILPDNSQAELAALKAGKQCLVKNPIAIANGEGEEQQPATLLETGEEIVVNALPLTVTNVVDEPITLENDGFVNGVQLIVYDGVYDQLVGEANYTECYLSLTAAADRKSVERAIKAFSTETGSSWLSYADTDQQLQTTYEQIQLLAWGVISCVGIIGILNIINTVYTNIHTRVAEIGIQRAVGMSIGGLYRTFMWEGIYYGITAAIIGSVGGYSCTIFIQAAVTDSLQLNVIPWVPILQATGWSILACLAATCIPLRTIAKLSIVNSITASE